MNLKKVLSSVTAGLICCETPQTQHETGIRKIALVGSPNVGKSVLFAHLTGTYVTVSNYPGTTVEVSRGLGRIEGQRFEVVDTPGMYSLLPLSEEERVARSILLEENPDLVLHVVDAKNLERMLILTVQLIEAGWPVVLALNMMDEAEASGLLIDTEVLERELGIPVVGTVGTTGKGIDLLRRVIGADRPERPVRRFEYSAPKEAPLEGFLKRIEGGLPDVFRVSRRCLSLLLLQGDSWVHQTVQEKAPESYAGIAEVVAGAKERLGRPIDYLLTLQRHRWTSLMQSQAVSAGEKRPRSFAEKLSQVLVNPITGLPILLLVLYLTMYKFVGQFAAGTAVDFLEGTVFEGWLNPFLTRIFEQIIPWEIPRDLFVGDYGVLTLGLRYAVAIILPIVTFFFLVFAIIEDVGYLPRLALLLDRVFKKMGLSGRAVIPMVLGLGCVTMATLVTRTLSTRRERMISMILLSVAVPCSAQLGVIVAMLSSRPVVMVIWAGVMITVYLTVGSLAARFIPGHSAPFYVEIPPLRWPKLSNVITKTLARVKWYFMEIMPLFLLASVLIWLGQLTGLFALAIRVLEYPVQWIGLPVKAAEVFLFGFFRRDYGVAGLYDLNKSGALNGVQLLVAAIALTLFLPCIAQLLITIKERSWKAGLAIVGLVLAISFGVAFVVYHVLTGLGISF